MKQGEGNLNLSSETPGNESQESPGAGGEPKLIVDYFLLYNVKVEPSSNQGATLSVFQ